MILCYECTCNLGTIITQRSGHGESIHFQVEPPLHFHFVRKALHPSSLCMTMSSMTFELNLNDDAVEYERGGGTNTHWAKIVVFFPFKAE